MAGLATVVGRDMRHALAGGCRTVVATETASCDLRVIDACGGTPGDDTVATFAGIAGVDMRRILARRRRAIVATHAIAGDAVVTKVGRTPGIGCMASLATVV